MSGFPGGLSPAQEEALAAFRERLADVLQPGRHDVAYLLRFLRARRFDLAKSERMLRTALDNRRKYGVDAILETYTPPQVLLDYMPWALLPGKSREGYRIIMIRPGAIDLCGLMRATSSDEMLRFRLWQMESFERALKDSRDGIFITVNDLDGVGTRHLYRPGLNWFIQESQFEMDMFPEILKTAYFINTPKIFSLIFNVAGTAIDAHTRSKFCMLGSDYQKTLLEAIPPESLPVRFGGTLSDECCREHHLLPGGMVPEAFYRGNDESYKRVAVGAGKTFSERVTIERAGTKLTWDFCTEEHDIGFRVHAGPLRTAALTCCAPQVDYLADEGARPETAVESKRHSSHEDSITGALECARPGEYVLVWDNTYSWLKGKVLKYKVDTFESEPAPPLPETRE